MTNTLAVKGGKTIRKVEINEVLESLAEPIKDEGLGLIRLKARAEKDGKEGYITLSGNQGTLYLETYSPYSACEKRIERVMQEMTEAIGASTKYVDSKVDELKTVKTGPL